MTRTRLPGRQAGLSLLELMVSLSIGLFLLLGVASIFVNSNQTYTDLGRAAQQIENGRFAVQAVGDDVALAGHYGRFSQNLAVPGSTHNPCAIDAASLRTFAAFPIFGYDAPSTSPIPTCIPVANHVAGTDIVVVRRADSQPTAAGSLVPQAMYMQANADPTNSSNPVIALGLAANFPLLNRDAATIAPIRRYHVRVYFIAPCSIPAGGGTTCTGASDDGGSPIPTLKRLELAVNPSTNALEMSVVSLVEGIENFQVDYGVDSDGDGVPNGSYVTLPAAAADWQNVVSVRINILARNLEATPGYTDARVYDMGTAGTVTPGGAYKRHVYNSVIRIVNISSRRES